MKEILTACAKISNLCIQAFGERPDSVTFEFPADGLFQDLSPAAPCSAALINGLLGRSADCPDAETAAAAAGISVSFERSALPCHPDYAYRRKTNRGCFCNKGFNRGSLYSSRYAKHGLWNEIVTIRSRPMYGYPYAVDS